MWYFLSIVVEITINKGVDMAKMKMIKIPAGTKVLSKDRGMITLQADVYVDATRAKDGGWNYQVYDSKYYTCAGVVTVLN